MNTLFWIRRFAIALICAFVLIALGQVLLRGRPLDIAIPHALSWAIITASIFIGTDVYRSRRGQHFALCGDTPEA